MTEKSLPKPSTVPFAWVILAIVFLASVAAPLNQFKVPPILPVLIRAFHIDLVQAGSLVSVFAVTGLLLALPAGIILRRLGPKVTGLIALGCLAGGSALGALSTSIALLLASRVIEGVGMGLVGVVAPATIAAWFPGDRQGAPMGIWATWVPVGQLAMYLAGPALAAAGGWQAVWWLGAGFSLAIMLAYALLVRLPSAQETAALAASASTPAAPPPPPAAEPLVSTPGTLPAARSDFLTALSNRDIWLLGLEFACFNMAFIGLATYYPTFLAEVRGYPLASAAWIASISTAVILIGAPLAGRLADRIGSRRLVFSLPYLVLAVFMLFPFRVTGWQIYAWQALQGIFVGAIPTATFAAAAGVMRKPAWAGYGLGVLMLAQNVGVLAGPVLFGQLVKTQGWEAAGLWMIPFCLLGFASGWLVRTK